MLAGLRGCKQRETLNGNTIPGLSVTDVDTGEDKFSPTVTGAAGNMGSLSITETGTWSYSVNNSIVRVQSLGKDQTKTDKFTVKSEDGTAIKDISITLTGANDAAVIGGTSTGSVTEDTDVVNGNLNSSGTLSINDVDTGESSFIAQSNTTGTYGNFNIGTDGTWSYAAANSGVQFLRAGQTKTEVFQVQSLDGTATKDIQVTTADCRFMKYSSSRR